MQAFETVEVTTDLLIIGPGMAGCGACVEAAHWAKENNIQVTVVDKAAMERSGAVAMGLSAINQYQGENTPIDYLDFASAQTGLGSKVGMDATNKWRGETEREWGRPITMKAEVKARVDEIWDQLGIQPGQRKPIEEQALLAQHSYVYPPAKINENGNL